MIGKIRGKGIHDIRHLEFCRPQYTFYKGNYIFTEAFSSYVIVMNFVQHFNCVLERIR